MEPYTVSFRFRVSAEGAEALEEHLDSALEHLVEDERVLDPDYGVSLAESVVDWTLTGQAESELDAMTEMLSALRAAIHAADGHTPNWERLYEQIALGVERGGDLAGA